MIRVMLFWILLANTVLGQPPASPEQLPNQGQAIGIGAVKVVADLEARIVELESRDIIAQIEAISTDEFAPNNDNLLSHFAEEHQGARLLKKLHEYIHQQIEKLRPNGAKSFIVIEATPDEYAKFMAGYGTDVLQAGWPIQRADKRPGQKVASIVAIGKTHFVHVGFLTRDVLQKFVDKATPRSQGKPLPKKLGWTVKRIVMHTMNGCPRCDDWKRDEQPQAQADGVTVEVVNEGRGIAGNDYPYFDVQYCSDDQCRSLRFGFMRYQTMKTAL